MRAKVRDTEIYFDIEGAGLVADGPRMREKPPAFIIHGGPGGDHTDLKPRFNLLGDRLQLVYFDHRGQGRSARGDVAKYHLDENVEDMEALRRHLGFEKIVSIGTSYGGMVAMAHAARYPQSVSHLVLCVTAAHSGLIARARQIVAERGTPEQQAALDQLWAGAIDSVDKLRRYYDVMGPLYALKYNAREAQASRERGIMNPEALNRAFGPGGFMHSYDVRAELKNIVAPTLVIAGRHDWICAPEFSEEIHRLIPGSELRIFENSSHSLRVDEPERLIETIDGFLLGGAKDAATR